MNSLFSSHFKNILFALVFASAVNSYGFLKDEIYKKLLDSPNPFSQAVKLENSIDGELIEVRTVMTFRLRTKLGFRSARIERVINDLEVAWENSWSGLHNDIEEITELEADTAFTYGKHLTSFFESMGEEMKQFFIDGLYDFKKYFTNEELFGEAASTMDEAAIAAASEAAEATASEIVAVEVLEVLAILFIPIGLRRHLVDDSCVYLVTGNCVGDNCYNGQPDCTLEGTPEGEQEFVPIEDGNQNGSFVIPGYNDTIVSCETGDCS